MPYIGLFAKKNVKDCHHCLAELIEVFMDGGLVDGALLLRF